MAVTHTPPTPQKPIIKTPEPKPTVPQAWQELLASAKQILDFHDGCPTEAGTKDKRIEALRNAIKAFQ